jgi:hypothetical protein
MVVGGHSRRCDCHCSLVELLCQFFRKMIVALIFQKSPRPPVLYFHDLDSSRVDFPMRECTSRIEYHSCFAPKGQHIA